MLNISEFFEFSKENSYFERILMVRMVRMVRIVRSLADRTFQLCRALDVLAGLDGHDEVRRLDIVVVAGPVQRSGLHVELEDSHAIGVLVGCEEPLAARVELEVPRRHAARVEDADRPRVRVRVSKIGKISKFLAIFWRARSRLYQNEILQENMRLTAFFKLYKICILLHPCNLKMLAKNRFENQHFL